MSRWSRDTTHIPFWVTDVFICIVFSGVSAVIFKVFVVLMRVALHPLHAHLPDLCNYKPPTDLYIPLKFYFCELMLPSTRTISQSQERIMTHKCSLTFISIIILSLPLEQGGFRCWNVSMVSGYAVIICRIHVYHLTDMLTIMYLTDSERGFVSYVEMCKSDSWSLSHPSWC